MWPPTNFMDNPPDVICDITDNETWNTCPECHKDWQDIPAIPGLLHRTRLCEDCKVKNVRPEGNRIH